MFDVGEGFAGDDVFERERGQVVDVVKGEVFSKG